MAEIAHLAASCSLPRTKQLWRSPRGLENSASLPARAEVAGNKNTGRNLVAWNGAVRLYNRKGRTLKGSSNNGQLISGNAAFKRIQGHFRPVQWRKLTIPSQDICCPQL